MNIIIDYPQGVRVADERQIVHFIKDGTTGCKRRPVNYRVSTEAVTCPECLRSLPIVKAKRTKKAWTTTTKREPDGETYRRGRAWLLTPKGQALVDKWEREEAE